MSYSRLFSPSSTLLLTQPSLSLLPRPHWANSGGTGYRDKRWLRPTVYSAVQGLTMEPYTWEGLEEYVLDRRFRVFPTKGF